MPSVNYYQQFQRHLNWCWAAVTVSVERHYDPASARTQCLLVDQELGRDDCCRFQFPSRACNATCSLDTALTAVGHRRRFLVGALTLDEIRGQINGQHPFGVRVAWLLGGAHVMVCSGYYQTCVGAFLLIKDPAFGPSLVPFAVFPRRYLGWLSTWTHTYYTD